MASSLHIAFISHLPQIAFERVPIINPDLFLFSFLFLFPLFIPVELSASPTDIADNHVVPVPDILQQFLSPLVIDLNDPVHELCIQVMSLLSHHHIATVLLMQLVVIAVMLLGLIYFDLFLVHILLHSPQVVVPAVEVICPGQSRVFRLLFTDIFLRLRHVHQQLLQFLLLFLLFRQLLPAQDVFPDLILRRRTWLQLEIDHCPAHLHGLSHMSGQVKSVSKQHECAEFGHVVLDVEPVRFELDHGVTPRHTDVVDAQIRVMAATQTERTDV